MVNSKIVKKDLVYPELSYQIVGVLFEVYKQLGSKYQEKYYQKAIAVELKKSGLTFTEQTRIPLNYKETPIGSYVLDFIIENKIALEIKKNDNFSYKNIEQVVAYLKALNLKLGILANFTHKGLFYKRILNIN
jgi:GxxExxY protein